MADLIEAQDRNNRIVLDTTVSADIVTKIPAMNGQWSGSTVCNC